MKKRMLAALFGAALLLQIPAGAEERSGCTLFEATFLQGWLCRDWSPERWRTEFTEMKAAGFRSVILQSAVDLTYQYTDESKPETDPAAYTLAAAYALYPTELVSGSEQAHALRDALDAAADSGMQVWIGTVSDSRWWAYGWGSPDDGLRTWAAENAAACSTLIRETAALYGEAYAPQIAGYYYNNEIWNIPDACTQQDQGAYEQILGENLRRTVEAAAEKPVLVSPFYNPELGTAQDYARFLLALAQASGMRRTDILAPQDGGGRECSPDVISEWMYAVQQSVRETVTFWVNNETFNPAYQPKPPAVLKSDYLAANCAQQHILFSWNHYYHAAANPEYAAYEQAFRQMCDEMRGDVNADGSFDIADAAVVCRWFMGDRIYLANWKAADFDGNGILNAADLSAMKHALLES